MNLGGQIIHKANSSLEHSDESTIDARVSGNEANASQNIIAVDDEERQRMKNDALRQLLFFVFLFFGGLYGLRISSRVAL